MSQCRKLSFLEAWANAIIGIVVSWLFTFFVLPHIGVVMDVAQASGTTAMFFVVSTTRSYVLRRTFNAMHERKIG